jgi:predicted acyltransferase
VPALTQVSTRRLAVDGRVLSIDRFRGVLVILMVVANYLSGIAAVPAFLKHAPDVGLTIIDVGAPCFVFAMGLTYGESFDRRAANGRAGAYRHVVVRNLALVGIGAILSTGGTQIAGQPSDWGVLQALGTAGLICLPFIRLGTAARFAIGAGLLVGYQVLIDTIGVSVVRNEVQGGLIGSLSWGALLILSTAVADVWRRGTVPMLWCCGVLALVAVLSAVIVPVSKTRVSLSYILLTLAIGAAGFLLIDLLSRALPPRAGFISWWGENALLLYILHLLLLGLVVLPAPQWWYVDASAWLIGAQLVAILGILSVIAWWLHRSGRRVRL